MGITSLIQESDQPGLGDNKVLDQFTIPVGDWAEQIVRWVDTKMEDKIGFDLLAVIEWPFKILFRTFVKSGGHHPFWEITDMPWWAVCLIFFVIGSAFRNIKIGLFAAGALAVCGMLGIEYWDEVSLTLGMVIVSVFLCAMIGIPLGVLCGRVDGVWSAVRPALDAMQVVHSFVYMLPFIFFFGIGFESSTMVTMIFAIPPLIRLTNLGVRQVPEDVVEASRAYGAPEWRVLLDVQLPLARPAIMTGLNQTLLLAISMLGIAALMGAGGLGLLVFRATANLDVALGASAGLALFTVAVVLDRISQTQATDGMNLFARINRAVVARRNPEILLAQEEQAAKTGDNAASAGAFSPLIPRERQGAYLAAAGAIISLVSLFLTWGNDAGLVSGYARRDDLDMVGQSFNGISASGGSWFGLLILAFSALIILSLIVSMYRPGEVGRWLGPDGTVFFAVASLITACSYAAIQETILVTEYSSGIGTYIAILGGIVATVGAGLWISATPYSSHTPLKAKVNYARIVIAVGCVVWTVLAGVSAWSFDQRQDTIITPEVQAQLDEVIEAARVGDIPAAEAGAAIATINASAKQDVTIYDGFNDDGPGLAPFTIFVSLVGLALSIPASGLLGLDEQKRWRWSVATAAVGIGMMSVSFAWIISIARVADANFVSGAGSFLFFVSGAFLTMTSRGVMAEFGRSKVFAADSAVLDTASESSAGDDEMADA